MRDKKTRPKRKKPKWQKVLSKAEIKHLKDVHVDTRKSFIEMNDFHNKRRQEVNALEPCYWCKHIALKMGLKIHGMGKLVMSVKTKPEPLKTEKPAIVMGVDVAKEPVKEKFLDLPMVYIIIIISTVGFGIASAVVFLKGW